MAAGRGDQRGARRSARRLRLFRRAPAEAPAAAKLPGADPVVTGLTPERIAEVEEGCRAVAGVRGTPRLYQYAPRAGGDLALVLTEDSALDCTVDGPGMPFNSGLRSGFDLGTLVGPVSVDLNDARAGGDVPGNRAQYRGQAGAEFVAGRVTADVASVTWEQRGETVSATVANGTFVAYLEHPSTWEIPNGFELGEVRAHDASGRLLGGFDPAGRGTWCAADPAPCGAGTRWR
ncbi:hypothetical protein [Saccharothrix longispora]|uniref:hypothetical protein n=1 Tax=Saccharothrix longispora TaxID=33920 RepID=UPI0028FDB3DD|nr:hypothetical protein [Saccharothrix longispora]MDU0290856.1 hypothetical protein [Saccharothrix longispora]